MKISTKAWCQAPEVFRGMAKVLFVALLTVSLSGVMSVRAEASTATMEQTPTKVSLKGKVVDENGDVLPGASVSVKNTTIGMSTTKEGIFLLNVPNEKITLVVTYVGYEKVEMEILNPSKEKELTITMKSDELAAEEVVVTGFINARKSSFTGTQTTVSGQEIMQLAPNNVMQALSIMEPSFRIIENIEMGSDPNTMAEAYLRGQSGMSNRQLDVSESLSPYETQNNPNLPLFVVDGFEISMEQFNDMDINTIQSVTILKDAQATALYGSRASNGVFVITTIPPEPGELRFNYNLTASVTAPDLTDYHLLNAKDKLAQEVATGYYSTSTSSAGYLTTYNNYMLKMNNIVRGVDTYWLSQPLRTQFNQSHSLNVSGGSNEFRFNFGLRYQNENGVMKDSYRDVYTADMTLEYRLQTFSIQNKVTMNIMERANSPYGSFSTYTQLLPYDSPYDLNTGELIPKLKGWGGSGKSDYTNPLYDVHRTNNSDEGNYTQFVNNLQVSYSPTQSLVLKGQFSVSKKDDATSVFTDPMAAEFDKYVYTYGGATGNTLIESRKTNAFEKGRLRQTEMHTVNWDSKLQATFNKVWDDHYLSATAGVNISGSKSNHESRSFLGFPSSAFKDPKYAYEQEGNPYFDDNISRLMGYIISGNYSYKNVYMVDFSYRRDGSSQFGTDNKFANFFSVGAGSNLHNMEWFKNNAEVISLLRLRANYGQTGKVDYPPYAARTTYEIQTDGWHATGIGATLVAMGNSNLSWETTHTVNIGLDLGLWNDRFTAEFNWYNKLTKDLITDVSLPPSAGFTSYKDNMGEVLNRGWEFKINYRVLKTKDIDMNIMVNGAHNKGTIKKISDSMKEYNERVNDHFASTSTSTIVFEKPTAKPVLKYEEGGSLTAIYAMPSLGISPATGDEVYMDLWGNPTYDWLADHQRIVGNTEPDLSGSFALNFRWKNLTISTAFQYQVGADRYNTTLVERVENLNYMGFNCDNRIMDLRWHKPGDVAQYKDVNDRTKLTRPTSRFLQRDDYVKFSSFNATWDFKGKWMKEIGLSRLNLSFNMTDIYSWTKIEIERGLSYPFARTFTLKLSAAF